jgi:hypothetical protein
MNTEPKDLGQDILSRADEVFHGWVPADCCRQLPHFAWINHHPNTVVILMLIAYNKTQHLPTVYPAALVFCCLCPAGLGVCGCSGRASALDAAFLCWTLPELPLLMVSPQLLNLLIYSANPLSRYMQCYPACFCVSACQTTCNSQLPIEQVFIRQHAHRCCVDLTCSKRLPNGAFPAFFCNRTSWDLSWPLAQPYQMVPQLTSQLATRG